MSWFVRTFGSTLGRKLLMALTGIFLILFLVVHLIGNLQLLISDGGESFNIYAETMGNNMFIQVVSKVNFILILTHIIVAIILTSHNKKARPVGYQNFDGNANSAWSSRNMGILGTVIFIFIAVHLSNFWWVFKYGEVPTITIDGATMNNYYTVVNEGFSQIWIVGLYVISMIFLAFHLTHGFQSAFQTLGLNHKKYTPAIKAIGKWFAILIPLGFAIIPIYMYFN
ncbi:succinate dehydrogenase cytochrome b subunit [Marinigracilibium pacificum]|uniref:Succinate dehydrogenase cytochrome b subunit n=1 Tax=Marinigracilibium pacificum TaxID=2729599 RepID=A0A848J6Q6_9BACT|nr:succinate dehydrogenase cytochrome b subunit [Marinigracilibium pacificum]NMM50200.1 succinate dehydrogenase cytochrome b subunit [Marinigracilibium pacificum]